MRNLSGLIFLLTIPIVTAAGLPPTWTDLPYFETGTHYTHSGVAIFTTSNSTSTIPYVNSYRSVPSWVLGISRWDITVASQYANQKILTKSISQTFIALDYVW